MVRRRVARDVMEDCRQVLKCLQERLGEKLVSVIVYGSAARGELREDSDIDLYVFSEGLPQGSLKRSLFLSGLVSEIQTARRITLRGKAPSELNEIVPLFLDLAADGVVLFDRGGIAAELLGKVRRATKRAGLVRFRTDRGFYGWRPRELPERGERIVVEF